MIERTRREFLSDLLKVIAVAADTPLLLSTDTAREETVALPQSLPHYLSLGFTYGGDECRFLNSVLDPKPKVSAETLINIDKTAEDVLKEDCSECEWDFARGAAGLNHNPQTNYQDLYPLYEAASLKGIKIVQAIGKDQPFYPPERLPANLGPKDPDFSKRYSELVYNFRKMMDEKGLTPHVAVWQLGNESLDLSATGDISSTVQDLENLKEIVKDTRKPTVINNFFSFEGPKLAWEITQKIADIAALDFYLQIENSRGTLKGLRSSLEEYIQTAMIPVVGLEEQTGTWKTKWSTFKGFSGQDFLNMFNILAPLVSVLGLWEVDKRYCFAKHGKELGNFRAIIQAMRQTSRWNNQDYTGKIVELAAYRAFRRSSTSSLAA